MEREGVPDPNLKVWGGGGGKEGNEWWQNRLKMMKVRIQRKPEMSMVRFQEREAQ